MKNKIIITNEDVGKRLDVFLQETFPDLTRSFIQKSIKLNNIIISRNKKELTFAEKTLKNGEKLQKNDIILYFFEKKQEINLTPKNLNLEIIYEDSDFVVINKPQGLVVHPCESYPDNTLVNGLIYQIKTLSNINGDFRPGIVHRLDKDTCGLILIAKNNESHINLAKQIANRECVRKYLALIEGSFKKEEGVIKTKIGRDAKNRTKMSVVKLGGKEAITEYKTIEIFDKFSLVEFSLITGRTHQIRVHSKHLNKPIVSDPIYGSGQKFDLEGQFLCAYRLEFKHPSTKEKMSFEIELPEHFQKILNNLRKNNSFSQ